MAELNSPAQVWLPSWCCCCC